MDPVSKAVEQLHYTWVPSGPTGQAGWQVVGASPGLSAGQFRAVMRFCSLPKQPSTGNAEHVPSSFGWWDSGNSRIAFHRTPRPLDGVPNNYVAHFLVGAPQSLPASQLLRRASSSFWWDGLDKGSSLEFKGATLGKLPSIELTDMAESEAEVPDVGLVAHILGLLLSLPKNRGIAIRLHPSALIGVLARISRDLPELCEHQTLSSIWNPQDPFCTVVGIGSGDSVPQGYLAYPDTVISPDLERIASASVDPRASHREIVMVGRLTAMQGRSGTFRRRDYCVIVLSLLALEEGVGEQSAVMSALATPAGARLLLNHPQGRRIVIDALAREDESAVAPLAHTVSQDEKIASTVASGLWDRVVQSGSPEVFSSALRVSRVLSIGLEHDFLDLALSNDHLVAELVESLSADEAMRVLLESDASGLGSRTRTAILYQSKWQERIATMSELSRPWRAAAIADGLHRNTVRVSVAARLLATDSELALETARQSSSEQIMLETLRAVHEDSQLVPTTIAMVDGLGWNRSADLVLGAAELVSRRYRPQLLRSLPVTQAHRRQDEVWDRVVSMSFQLEVQGSIDSKRPSIAPSTDFLEAVSGSGGPRAGAWMAALCRPPRMPGMGMSADGITLGKLRSAIQRLRVLDPNERSYCAILILHTGLAGDLEPAAMADVLALLAGQLDCSVDALLEWVLMPDGSWVGTRGSRWLYSLSSVVILVVAQGRVSLEGSLLSSGGLQSSVEHAIKHLTGSEVAKSKALAQSCGPIVQKWWKLTARRSAGWRGWISRPSR